MKRSSVAAAASLLGLALALPLVAQNPRDVSVTFSLAPPYDFFSAEKKRFIESQVTGEIVKALQDAFPIYTFRAGSDGMNRLEITLRDDPVAGGGPTPPAAFIVSLNAHKADSLPLRVLYRSAERWGEPIPPFETFARELSDRFAEEVERNRHGFMTVLFRQIVLAKNGWPLPASRAFVLPFAADEFAEGTQFSITAAGPEETTWIVQAVPDGETAPRNDLPAEYHRRLRARVESPAEALQLMTSGERLTPTIIRLITYNRGAAGIAAARPSTFARSSGDAR